MARLVEAYIEIERASTDDEDGKRLSLVLDNLRKSSLAGYKIEAVEFDSCPLSCVVPFFGFASGVTESPYFPVSPFIAIMLGAFGIILLLIGGLIALALALN
jgi:hypothetical protein